MLFCEKRRKKKCAICGEFYSNRDRTFVKIEDKVCAIKTTTLVEGMLVIKGLCPKCLMAATYGAYAERFNVFPKIVEKGKRRMLAMPRVEAN